MTLNELASLSKNKDNICLVHGLMKHLHKIGLYEYSESIIRNKLQTEKCKLILDSIDEAIVQDKWIIEQLISFSNLYEKCQIITSSRFTVAEVSNLNFTNISLLPFNEQQKREFFNKWFNMDSTMVDPLMSHLKVHKELNNIITNPLSATIMATLQEKSVDLPTSESSLYCKRFELLSGVFDKFKGINRSKLDPVDLIKHSYQLAYEMHKHKKRSLNYHSIVSIINNKVDNLKAAEKIANELIFPSEILLLEHNEKYSFGHLRFQEYLTSNQIVHLRSIPTHRLIKDIWWQDVYLLYSQHATEIDWILNDAAENGYSNKVKKLLRKMILNRPKHEQIKLTKRLEISIADELDNYN